MTQSGNETTPVNDEALEQLLGQATPRPSPPPEQMMEIRETVKGEWQQLVRRRVRRRRLTMLAAAASVTLAIAVSMNTWLAPVAKPEAVATLEKAHGTIYLLGEQSQVRIADELGELQSGQTIRTGRREAGVGLRWHGGGSLRLDVDTEVNFVSTERIKLNSGRVYFDSQDLDVALTIATPYGEVTHLGTQYMTSVAKELLVVSVRDGLVAIDGQFRDAAVKQGERVTLAGSRMPERQHIEVFGTEWEWLEAVAPDANFNGKMLINFLRWVSSETGLELDYESDDVKTDVMDAKFNGRVETAPREALKTLIKTTDFKYSEMNGVLLISRAEQ